MIEIDEEYHHEHEREEGYRHQWDPRSRRGKPNPHPGEESPARGLHQRIPPADRRAARATPPAQDQKARQGDVVASADGSVTVRAARSRPDDGEPTGEAIDDHIQETAKNRAEYEHQDS